MGQVIRAIDDMRHTVKIVVDFLIVIKQISSFKNVFSGRKASSSHFLFYSALIGFVLQYNRN